MLNYFLLFFIFLIIELSTIFTLHRRHKKEINAYGETVTFQSRKIMNLLQNQYCTFEKLRKCEIRFFLKNMQMRRPCQKLEETPVSDLYDLYVLFSADKEHLTKDQFRQGMFESGFNTQNVKITNGGRQTTARCYYKVQDEE